MDLWEKERKESVRKKRRKRNEKESNFSTASLSIDKKWQLGGLVTLKLHNDIVPLLCIAQLN